MNKVEAPGLLISATSLRSGSTWLQRIAHAATDIFVWGEPFPLVESLSYVFRRFQDAEEVRLQETKDSLSRSQDPTVWVANANPPLDSLKRGFVALFSEYYGETHGRARYGWKEVRYGLSELEFLWNLFPELRVLLLVRNPIDVIRSLRALAWIGRGEDTQSVSWVCQNWSRCTRDYLLLRDHPNTFFLRYEDITSRLGELLAFIGGQFNEKVSQALNTFVGSTNERSALSSEDERTIMEICSNEMKTLGYLGVEQSEALERGRHQEQPRSSFLKRSELGAQKRLNELQAQVAEKEQAVQGLSAHVAQRDEAVAALQAEVATKEQAIRVLSEQLAAKDAQFERITSSLGWRLLSYYGWVKYRYLLPIYRLLGLMPPQSTPMDTASTSGACGTTPTSDFGPEAPLRPSLYDVIVLPIIDWEFRFQRPQQIAMGFVRTGHRVFYVRTAFREHQKTTIQAIEEGVFEVQLPGPSHIHLYSHAIDEHLRGTLSDAFASLRQEFGIVEAVCFVNLPFWRPIALTLRDRFGWKVVYDCMDYHGGFSNTAKAMLKEEDELSRTSDLVVTSSRPLFAEQSQRSVNCLLVPNAADFDHFRFAHHLLPEELRNLGKPIVGYYGAIADWFDSELIHELALARPQWNFVLIGRTRGADLAPLRHSKNVHLLGEKPYAVLPPYLHAFDVCIIPFKKLPLTEATNPVKLFEFLSAGKPVVATDLTELRHYADYVELASTLEQWLLAIEIALNEYAPERVTARIDFARHNTWDERVAQIKQHINSLFPKASIIVVTYNNLDYTRLCLESIYKRTVYPNYEVIVVDNASMDGTVEFLKTFGTTHPNFAPIFNEMNEGFPGANNRGIAAATGEYMVFLNNDTIVPRGWLSGLINHLRDAQVGIVGPVTNFSGNESRIEVDYRTPDEMESFAERYTRAHEGQTFDISMLALFCIAMRRSVIDEVGLLDERFGIGMFEDDDYALRIKQKGYKVICAEDVFVHHWGSASFSKLSQEAYQRLFDENRRKFEEKWGMRWEPHRYRPGR